MLEVQLWIITSLCGRWVAHKSTLLENDARAACTTHNSFIQLISKLIEH